MSAQNLRRRTQLTILEGCRFISILHTSSPHAQYVLQSHTVQRRVQTGMELRVLFTAAHGSTWYGRWGYGFGRGGYNLQRANWDAASTQLHGAPLADVLHDFRDIDRAVVAIIRRYWVRRRCCFGHCVPKVLYFGTCP